MLEAPSYHAIAAMAVTIAMFIGFARARYPEEIISLITIAVIGAVVLSRRPKDVPPLPEPESMTGQGDEPLSPMRGGWRLLQPLVAFSDRRIFRYRPVPVRAVTDGHRLGELELLALPGHTAGHCGYWLPRRRVVFAGDASRAASSPFSFDRAAVRRSLDKLAELDAELYCFGHGPPLRGPGLLRQLPPSAERGSQT
jgi:glyoxylase-like metal-dependent hydrolase (beta-lactamase superfamily II)